MRLWFVVFTAVLVASPLVAQDRDTKVRNDRKSFAASKDWIYNDLNEGIRAAKKAGKPLFVVFRCIPCEACQEFDDDVARRDPIIRDMLDRYVCVRIVQANTIDLTRFQHDFDQSFAVYLMNPDLTIYGRFGTRSARPESEDLSLEGLRKAMEAGLRIHKDYMAVKSTLAGKQVGSALFKTPRDYPSLTGKYGTKIDYEEKTAKSCMHCHQVREAERSYYHDSGKPIPEDVLFPYPDPSVLGLKLDPKEMATIERVTASSIAARAGLQAGDEILSIGREPLLSIADLQWRLHNLPESAKLPIRIRRDGKTLDLSLDLPAGWRRGDISWRATTWDLRRMALGGLKLAELDAAQRAKANLPQNAMALRVDHVGQYGSHAVAKRAGALQGDIIVSYDGRTDLMTESEVIAYALQKKQRGDVVPLTIHRGGTKQTLKFPLQ